MGPALEARDETPLADRSDPADPARRRIPHLQSAAGYPVLRPAVTVLAVSADRLGIAAPGGSAGGLFPRHPATGSRLYRRGSRADRFHLLHRLGRFRGS